VERLYPREVRELSKSYRLLGIVQEYAPTGKEQEMVAEIYRQAQKEGRTEDDLVLMMAGFICDGLRHGNWPWVTPPYVGWEDDPECEGG
jgi:hypothetical protein